MKEFLLVVSFCLLGYARAAAVQASEPPGSMKQQASVQQFSGEDFSPANPSDREGLYATSGKMASSERPSEEHTLVARASDEHGSGKHASGEPESDERAAGSERVAGEQRLDQQRSGQQPLGEQPLGEKPFGDQPSGERSSGEEPAGGQPSDEQPTGGKPLGERSLDEKPSGEQAASEQTPREQDAGEQASEDQSPGEKHPGEQPAGSPSSSASLDTGLKCLTCSYMNDQGICLRGEGICSTQKSQQCMLKKIFEGGKLQFMVQGCESMCPSMNLYSHGTRMHIICCRSQSLCNKV